MYQSSLTADNDKQKGIIKWLIVKVSYRITKLPDFKKKVRKLVLLKCFATIQSTEIYDKTSASPAIANITKINGINRKWIKTSPHLRNNYEFKIKYITCLD